MNLREYFEQFEKFANPSSVGQGFTMTVAAEVAAAYEVGLSFEQLQRFIARRAEITSVACALKGPTVPVSTVERILEARKNGLIYPRDILANVFSPSEIQERFGIEKGDV